MVPHTLYCFSTKHIDDYDSTEQLTVANASQCIAQVRTPIRNTHL